MRAKTYILNESLTGSEVVAFAELINVPRIDQD
jgi:hypothetical protein